MDVLATIRVCQGDVEEAQGLLKLCDQFKVERDDLKAQIGLKAAALGPDGKKTVWLPISF